MPGFFIIIFEVSELISISDIIALINKANEIANNVKSIELNKVLLELQTAIIQFGTQNLELQEKFSELKKYIEIPNDIFIDDEGFICKKGDSNKYCPKCWNKERKLSLMPKTGVKTHYNDIEKPYDYMCSACNFVVESKKEKFN